MSVFVNADGSFKNYAIVDDDAHEVLGACSWCGEASKMAIALSAPAGRKLAVHNLTHPACPTWLQDVVKADPEYCGARAMKFMACANIARRKAVPLVQEADDWVTRADEWFARIK